MVYNDLKKEHLFSKKGDDVLNVVYTGELPEGIIIEVDGIIYMGVEES